MLAPHCYVAAVSFVIPSEGAERRSRRTPFITETPISSALRGPSVASLPQDDSDYRFAGTPDNSPSRTLASEDIAWALGSLARSAQIFRDAAVSPAA